MNDYMSNVMTGLETVGNAARECGMNDDDLHALLNVFLLLYADDTVIFAEKPEQLQDGLNRIKSYCDLWKLKLNPSFSRKPDIRICFYCQAKTRTHRKLGTKVI